MRAGALTLQNPRAPSESMSIALSGCAHDARLELGKEGGKNIARVENKGDDT
jgi:hypothetical protein